MVSVSFTGNAIGEIAFRVLKYRSPLHCRTRRTVPSPLLGLGKQFAAANMNAAADIFAAAMIERSGPDDLSRNRRKRTPEHAPVGETGCFRCASGTAARSAGRYEDMVSGAPFSGSELADLALRKERDLPVRVNVFGNFPACGETSAAYGSPEMNAVSDLRLME